jgi:hypothetical protein
MRVKSKYRIPEFRDGGHVPELSTHERELLNSETPAAETNISRAPDEGPAVAVATDTDVEVTPPAETPPQSEPRNALSAQLESLQQAEQLQRAQQQAQAETEARRREWLTGNSLAQQHVAALNVLHRAAINGGLADMSPEYVGYMQSQLEMLNNQQPANNGETPMSKPQRVQPQTPDFEPQQRSSIVSAPVSREAPGGPRVETSPERTVLTAEERAIARASRISDVEYARNKQRMEAMKRAGIIQ